MEIIGVILILIAGLVGYFAGMAYQSITDLNGGSKRSSTVQKTAGCAIRT